MGGRAALEQPTHRAGALGGKWVGFRHAVSAGGGPLWVDGMKGVRCQSGVGDTTMMMFLKTHRSARMFFETNREATSLAGLFVEAKARPSSSRSNERNMGGHPHHVACVVSMQSARLSLPSCACLSGRNRQKYRSGDDRTPRSSPSHPHIREPTTRSHKKDTRHRSALLQSI